jgi:uncharacterized protein (DUF934 family)
MALIKNRALTDDPFVHVADDAPVTDTGDVIVSLERWNAERDVLVARRGRTGVRIPGDTEPAALEELLPNVAVIAIEFPKFTDGRGYSTARLLRQHHGYEGELRAIGHVLRDQIFYMHRCGFDAFELAPGKDEQDALLAFEEFSVTYQPAVDEELPLWRRR